MTRLIDKVRREIYKFAEMILKANTAVHTEPPGKATYLDMKDMSTKTVDVTHRLVHDPFALPPVRKSSILKRYKKFSRKDLCIRLEESAQQVTNSYTEGFYDALVEVIDFIDESLLNEEVSSFRKTRLGRLSPPYDLTAKTYDEYTEPAISNWIKFRKEDFESKWASKWSTLSIEEINEIKHAEYEWCYPIVELATHNYPIALRRPKSKTLKQNELQPYFIEDGKDNSIDNIKNQLRKKLNEIFSEITGE
jgi:hypothetical protein